MTNRCNGLQYRQAVGPEHKVIVATHSIHGTQRPLRQTCHGHHQVWQLRRRNVGKVCPQKPPNVFMVVSGHFGGVGLQTSTNDAGGKVFEMLTDYQNLKNGGNGWLRTLRFVPAENKIHVTAYSPLLDETNEDPKHTLVLDYEMLAPVEAGGGK